MSNPPVIDIDIKSSDGTLVATIPSLTVSLDDIATCEIIKRAMDDMLSATFPNRLAAAQDLLNTRTEQEWSDKIWI